MTFVFLYNPNVLCEISENFSRQTIWDLPEKFQLQEIYRCEEECIILKITIISSEMEWNHIVIYKFRVFSDFCVFWYNHNEPCEISEKFFLTNNLRLVKEVPAPRNPKIWGGMYNSQNHYNFVQNGMKTIYLCTILSIFGLLWLLV